MPVHPSDDGASSSTTRRARLVDRPETGITLLVATWTAGFVARSRLEQSDRLSDFANEALLSLLFVVPIMLVGWGALALVDRWFKVGWFRPRDRR
jgi:hypothetical protein